MIGMVPVDEILIPKTYEEIDAAWMGAALGTAFPGVSVRTTRIVDVLLGACVKLRVAVEYDQNRSDLPSTLIVKGNFGRQGPELDFMFDTEMRSYRDIVSGLPLNTPRCYYAGGSGGATILLFEDLAVPDCRFGRIEQPLEFKEAVSLLDQLAMLHARYWGWSDADSRKFPWIEPTLSSGHSTYLHNILKPEQWERYLSLPRGVAVPRAMAKDAARLARALDRQQAFHRAAPQTLCHGDAHGANIYFNTKGGGFFDWFIRSGPWFHDVTYLIAGTLDIGDRRRWESELIGHYLQRLEEYGVIPPTRDDALYCYRRELIFGYILMIGNGESEQYWKETATTAAAIRFAIAAEDHGMITAIESDKF